MHDDTEPIRRVLVTTINQSVQSDDKETEKQRLQAIHGTNNVWDTQELAERFEVIGFMAPFCVVKDKTTQRKGCVMFQHKPRFYFAFQED